MFSLPLIFTWISPYTFEIFFKDIPTSLMYPVLSDILLLVSLFVLGGDFWEKLRSLFLHKTYVCYRDDINTIQKEN
jgi:hypothetical protein